MKTVIESLCANPGSKKMALLVMLSLLRGDIAQLLATEKYTPEGQAIEYLQKRQTGDDAIVLYPVGCDESEEALIRRQDSIPTTFGMLPDTLPKQDIQDNKSIFDYEETKKYFATEYFGLSLNQWGSIDGEENIARSSFLYQNKHEDRLIATVIGYSSTWQCLVHDDMIVWFNRANGRYAVMKTPSGLLHNNLLYLSLTLQNSIDNDQQDTTQQQWQNHYTARSDMSLVGFLEEQGYIAKPQEVIDIREVHGVLFCVTQDQCITIDTNADSKLQSPLAAKIDNQTKTIIREALQSGDRLSMQKDGSGRYFLLNKSKGIALVYSEKRRRYKIEKAFESSGQERIEISSYGEKTYLFSGNTIAEYDSQKNSFAIVLEGEKRQRYFNNQTFWIDDDVLPRVFYTSDDKWLLYNVVTKEQVLGEGSDASMDSKSGVIWAQNTVSSYKYDRSIDVPGAGYSIDGIYAASDDEKLVLYQNDSTQNKSIVSVNILTGQYACIAEDINPDSLSRIGSLWEIQGNDTTTYINQQTLEKRVFDNTYQQPNKTLTKRIKTPLYVKERTITRRDKTENKRQQVVFSDTVFQVPTYDGEDSDTEIFISTQQNKEGKTRFKFTSENGNDILIIGKNGQAIASTYNGVGKEWLSDTIKSDLKNLGITQYDRVRQPETRYTIIENWNIVQQASQNNVSLDSLIGPKTVIHIIWSEADHNGAYVRTRFDEYAERADAFVLYSERDHKKDFLTQRQNLVDAQVGVDVLILGGHGDGYFIALDNDASVTYYDRGLGQYELKNPVPEGLHDPYSCATVIRNSCSAGKHFVTKSAEYRFPNAAQVVGPNKPVKMGLLSKGEELELTLTWDGFEVLPETPDKTYPNWINIQEPNEGCSEKDQ